MKKISVIILFSISIFILSGCLDTTPGNSIGNTFTIKLNGDSIESDCSSALVMNTSITITEAGTYNITGKLNDGQIIVEAIHCAVELVMDNVDITCSHSAPVYIKTAKDTVIILKENTVNSFTDGTKYFDTSDEANAAIFSKDDLVISGKGSMTITANFNDALASKDELTIQDCNLTIYSVGDGIRGKDNVVISNAKITATVQNDGIKTTNDVDLNRGYMTISDSYITINSVDEAISAINKLTIHKSEIMIDTQNNGIKTNTVAALTDSIITITTADDDIKADTIEKDGNTIITVNGNVVQ